MEQTYPFLPQLREIITLIESTNSLRQLIEGAKGAFIINSYQLANVNSWK